MTQAEELSLPEALVKTIQHFVPQFWSDLSKVGDFRDPRLIIYPIELELFGAILFLMLRTGARRNIKYKLGTPAFIANLKLIWERFYPGPFPTLLGQFPETLFHGDTLNYLLSGIAPEHLHEYIRKPVIKRLLRKRCLEAFRLMEQWYVIAVDGTGFRAFRKRHCEHCLRRKLESGVVVYLHQVLEAKLVLPGLGMALSIGTEFIENEDPNASKQDCEQKAFLRLAKQLRSDFPQLNICLAIDGLYLTKPMIDVCRRNRWHYLITFKEGSAPALFEEYEALLKLTPENALRKVRGDAVASYRWINDIDWDDRVVHVLENREQTAKEVKRFVWVADFRIDRENVEPLEQDGGRSRWNIEESFNIQKNGGYGLEHAFSNDNTATKCFYLLTQIAHIFNQLMEKGSLLRERIETELGSLKVLSERLWAALIETRIDPLRLRAILARRIQIRFDTS